MIAGLPTSTSVSTLTKALWHGCLSLSLVAAFSELALAVEAELEFNYLPIAHVRTDPIVNDSCLSDHVHTFYGPPKVSPDVTTGDLIGTDSSEHSGLVEENKSLYWHPSIYRVSSDGVFTLDEIYYASIYYFWDTDNNNNNNDDDDDDADRKPSAFPEGFRMIASDREAFAECVVGGFKPCLRADGCGRPDGLPQKTFFPSGACDMLEITMDFPSCWDGRIDSPNHRDHVAYPDDEDDSCPPSHDRRIPTLSISIYIKDYDGGYHTWSDLSDAFHTDYLSGWDTNVMETFLEGCGEDTEHCDRFLTWKPGTGPTGCDSHDEKRAKLERVLPPLPDTTAIADEAVTNISQLPRGECRGPVTDPGPTQGPTPKATTAGPTKAPTRDSDDEGDDDNDEDGGDDNDKGSCVDDPDFRYKNKASKHCGWVSRSPARRCSYIWKDGRVRDYCLEACDECE